MGWMDRSIYNSHFRMRPRSLHETPMPLHGNTVFHLGGVNLAAAGSDVIIWNLQLWTVFQTRFQNQSKGEEVFASFGALRKGINLHKAINDCVAQLLALMRVLKMEESEFNAWFVHYTDLSPIQMGWMDPSIYNSNFRMRPRSLHEKHQVKHKENAAPVTSKTESEQVQFWANYDRSKVASTMAKYRKPAAKVD
ncbi:hypothetical protein QBC32DRAFT_366224 [Pseudoneurospora amorphoporcata]|uniref:Uncharacterized protein n=1 Tax=Pseudoneurospora amorphoporcata TaxID=241081 RepID=A0AAN6NJ48_9PEZI|nr:hypothetical protein QBC32DRAFT_366224 [Pseudoneurospora amorphoporcata]